jgi:DNA-binding CsgD family transcriptional regulator
MVDDLRSRIPHLNVTPVLGRDHEQATFNRLIDELFQGSGGFAIVTGEAGIGKTTLVRLVTARAAVRGALVLTGACYEYDLPTPYAVWNEAFRHIDPASGYGPSPLHDDEVSGIDSLRSNMYAYLSTLATSRPLVLVLEDLQWADEPSLDLLRYVARQRGTAPILLIITSRAEELKQEQPLFRMLPLIIRESRPVRVSLRPLDEAAVQELIRNRYPTLPHAETDRIVEYLLRYSEGNPFFIEELVNMLEYKQILTSSSGGWHLGTLPAFPVPPLVRQVIDERLERLKSESRFLLEIASVIGVEIPLDLWQSVSQAGEDSLMTAISDALGERMIEESRGFAGYRFRHAIIRGVLYERLSFVDRREFHRKVADWLATQPGAEPGVIAHHYLQANERRAADWLIKAGTQAARSFALRDAAAHYERALDILEHDPVQMSDHTWLLCALAETYRFTDADRALAYVTRAMTTIDHVDDHAMKALAAWCQARIRGFHQENVVEDLRRASDKYTALTDEDKHRILQTPLRYVVSEATLAQDLALYGQFQDALSHAQAFLDQNNTPASRAEYIEIGNAYFGMAIASAALGDPDHARMAFEQSRTAFQRTENYQMISNCLYWELSTVAQVYDADRPYRRAQLRQEEINANRRSELTRSESTSHQVSTSETSILDGLWEECRTSATARLQVPASRVPSARKLAHLDWLQGHPEHAWEHVLSILPDGQDERPGKRFFLHRHELQWIAAELALDAGDLSLALAWIEAIERWLAWSGKVTGRYIPEILRSRYHAIQNDFDEAMRHAAKTLDLASSPHEPLGVLAAHRTLASLKSRLSDAEQASTHIEFAIEIARKCGAPYETALTQLVQGEMLLVEGNTRDAKHILTDARRIAEYLGATPLLTRITTALKVTDKPSGAVSTVPFGLTRRELDVLRLVAQGMTDATIAEALSISPRTVGGHLQSIFNKTGVSSRTAATALAYQHGIFSAEE